MTLSSRTSKWLLPAIVALPLLIACSSGNNNKNNNAATNSNSAAATQAAPATPVATPAVTATTVLRAPTPAAGIAASTPSRAGAATPAANGTPSTGSATDPQLEAALQKAILQQSDLPTGFTLSDTSDAVDSSAGEVASYEATFAKQGQGAGGALDIEAIVIGLVGFKDNAAAVSGFKDLQQQITSIPGSSLTLTPVTNAPKVGDETQAFKVEGSDSGITIGGYAIIWRHGRLGGAVIHVGVPAPANIDVLSGLAQAQDTKLAAIH